jgi:hypothetical protein
LRIPYIPTPSSRLTTTHAVMRSSCLRDHGHESNHGAKSQTAWSCKGDRGIDKNDHHTRRQ